MSMIYKERVIESILCLDYHVRMNEVNTANKELAKHSQIVEQDNLLLRVS